MANPQKSAFIGAAVGAVAGALVIIREDWDEFPGHPWATGALILGGAIGVGAISAVPGLIVGWLYRRERARE
jgi:hypothetical protein